MIIGTGADNEKNYEEGYIKGYTDHTFDGNVKYIYHEHTTINDGNVQYQSNSSTYDGHSTLNDDSKVANSEGCYTKPYYYYSYHYQQEHINRTVIGNEGHYILAGTSRCTVCGAENVKGSDDCPGRPIYRTSTTYTTETGTGEGFELPDDAFDVTTKYTCSCGHNKGEMIGAVVLY